ncbi:MAG TPA: hypothetical protein VJ385_09175 [Fibrobacteria bacterium]|nr:hypothetical protein [Fibrobacteria bacterium]
MEFFLLAALIGIGVPVAILMGVRSGEKAAAELYPPEEGAVMSPWPGMRLADADAPAFRKAWSVD